MLSERPRQYQPTITRLPCLILLFVFTLALISLTELACRRLPARNSDAFAILQLKRLKHKRARIVARSPIENQQDAADPSDFLALGPSSALSIPDSLAPSAADSVYLPSEPSVVPQSSIVLPPPTSLYVPAESSIGPKSSIVLPPPTSLYVPAETSVGDSAQDASDVPTQSSIGVPVQTSISDPIPASIDVLVQNSADVSGPSLFPDGSPATSVYLPLEPPVSQSLQKSSPRTADNLDATAPESVYLPLGTSAPPASPAGSTYLPPDSAPTHTPVIKPGYPVPSVYLPLSPTIASGTADVPPKSAPTVPLSVDISNYLPLGPQSTYRDLETSLYLPLQPKPTFHPFPDDSGYLPLGPTATYSTPDDSAYLPLGPTSVYSTPDDSAYLPLGPTAVPSAPDDSAYLPLGPTSAHSTPDDSAYLPLGPTAVPSTPDDSAYLPLGPTAVPSTPDDSAYLPLGPTSAHSTPDDSAYLPLGPTAVPSTPDDSAYLPLGPTSVYSTPDDSAYLPLGPTATYSTPDDSAYLPLSGTKSIHPVIHESEFLPLGPSVSPTPSREVQPYIRSSLYLPLGPAEPTASDDPVVFGDETDYLPLGPVATSSDHLRLAPVATALPSSDYLPLVPVATALPSSDYLPLVPVGTALPSSDYLPLVPVVSVSSKSKDVAAFQYPSEYLPVSRRPKSQAYLPASEYLPLDPVDASVTPLSPGAPAETAYLPLKSSNAPTDNTYRPAPAPVPSAFLPVLPHPTAIDSAYLPLSAHAPQRSAYLPLPPGANSQPKNQDKAQDIRTQNVLINPPAPTGVFEGETYSLGANGAIVMGGKTFDRSSPTTAVLDNGKTLAVGSNGIAILKAQDAKTLALPSVPTGVFEGENYSLGANGAVVIGGKTFDRSSPTTAVLDSGKTIAVGSNVFAILGAQDATTFALPTAPTGVFEGETYSVGANGALIIGGKTFDRSSQSTAVLSNGKTIEVGPGGIAVLGAQDAKTFALPAEPTGVFQGETYSLGANGAIILGGKTFDRSSPTTAILGNGKTVEVGPSGIAIFGGEDARLRYKTFAQPPARTGMFQGEAYSIGSNGAVIIGGKTFDRSSPTTAILRNGKTIEVGPSGIAIFGANDGELPSKTFAEPPARSGVFQGETYSIGPNGAVIIGGKTFDSSSPTTAVLQNGKTVEVGPSGIAILAADIRPVHTTALPENAKAYAATTGVVGGETYSAGSDGKIIIGGKTFDRASSTTAILDNGKTVEIGPTSIAILSAKDSGSGPVKNYIAPNQYVLGAFVPVIVAVIFTIPWQILNAAVKEIEPFYQLQREDGATAADSLALEYRSSINIVATFTAIRKGHFLVWWSGLISIVALALAPLATETVFIGFQGRCTPHTGREACIPELNVYPVAARILQGILSFMALLTLALAYSLHRGKTGLRANALSIAGLAALFQNQQVVEDFRRLNPHYTTSKMVSSALRDNRYRIGAFFEEDGSSAYGLVKCNHDSALMDPNYRTMFRRGKKYATVNVTATEDQERPKKHRTFSSYFTHPAAVVVFAAFVAGLETLVIYYNQTGGDTGFERWMDSQNFGVAFLFTALGVMIKMFWTHLDDELRNMEPYRQLLTGAVKANDSILLAPHSNPFTGLIYSLHKRHFFNAYVSLVAILCLPLIVALASIPFKAGLTFIAYRTSTYITIGVLSLMLIGIFWLLLRGRMPEMVRRPDTIASVLLFICGSNMREDFKGMSLMSRQEREEVVMCWEKTYAMGNVIGVDGVERQAVDESEFVTAEMK